MEEKESKKEKEFLDAPAVCLRLNIKSSTLYSMCLKRKLPFYKPFRKLMFLRDDIEKIILESRVQTIAEIEEKAIDEILSAPEEL